MPNRLYLAVHRGTREIGGSCIGLNDGETRLLLDVGLPLSKESKFLDVAALNPSAVLISHPHMDHCGLIESLDSDVPVYIGKLGHSLIEATRVFRRKEPLTNRLEYVTPWQPFAIGRFVITPYLVDHSSPEAFAFLIECDGKRIMYSGDLRGHGRKGKVFKKMLEQPPEDVDLLLMEGTMVHRSNNDFPDEQSVEERMVEVLENRESLAVVISSSQNIDRVVSAYRACKRTGRQLVVDIYTAWVLEQMKRVSDHTPNIDWDLVKVYAPGGQYAAVKKNPRLFSRFTRRCFDNRVKDEVLVSEPGRYLALGRVSKRWSNRIGRWREACPVSVIYSQWLGYLEPERWEATKGAKEIAALRDELGDDFVYAHTSGHAPVEDLQRLVDAVKPGKLLPVHTEYPEAYEQFGVPLISVKDGETIEF